MPDPISSNSSPSPTDWYKVDPNEPNMSVDPDDGGYSPAPLQSDAASEPVVSTPAPKPGGLVSQSESEPSALLESGPQKLVRGYIEATGQAMAVSYTPAGRGNFGGQLALGTGSVVVKDGSVGQTTQLQASIVSAELNIGTQNSDGSTGAHIKAQASLVSAELTTGSPTLQLTVGVDFGVGLEASSGERDLDADGKTEYCVRAGAGVVVGGCIEPAQIAEDFQTAMSHLARVVSSQRALGAMDN